MIAGCLQRWTSFYKQLNSHESECICGTPWIFFKSIPIINSNFSGVHHQCIITTRLLKTYIHSHPLGATSTSIKAVKGCSRVLSNNPGLGVSHPSFAWLLTEHSSGKCQGESDFLICCSLPRSIRSFHRCFGIDLRPNVVSVDRGLASRQVQFAAIWIKDNPSSTAPDKPWGRSITLLHLRHNRPYMFTAAKCTWLLKSI